MRVGTMVSLAIVLPLEHPTYSITNSVAVSRNANLNYFHGHHKGPLREGLSEIPSRVPYGGKEPGVSQCSLHLPARCGDEEVVLALPVSSSLVVKAPLWLTPHPWCTTATSVIEIRGREFLSRVLRISLMTTQFRKLCRLWPVVSLGMS